MKTVWCALNHLLGFTIGIGFLLGGGFLLWRDTQCNAHDHVTIISGIAMMGFGALLLIPTDAGTAGKQLIGLVNAARGASTPAL